MAIILRNTKGLPLTHEELDGNFTDLNTRVGTLESTADSDNQTLTLTGDTLSISGGNSVDLSKYTDTVFSGDYDDLTNKPTIPADVSDLTDTGNLLGSTTGDITFTGSTISAPDDTSITVQALDFNSTIRSRLSLSPDSGAISMRGFSNEDSRTFDTFDWSSANWIASGSGGSLVLVGAATVNDFLNNELNYAINIRFSINGGTPENLESYGYTTGTQTLSIGTASAPETDPTAVTEVEFFYTFSSSVGVDYDGGTVSMSARGDMNIRLESDLDVNLIAGDDVRIEGADSFRLINNSTTAPIRIITDDNNNSYTWAFEANGTLTFPDNTVQSTAFTGNLTSSNGIDIDITSGEDINLTASDDINLETTGDTGDIRLRSKNIAYIATNWDSDFFEGEQWTFNTDGTLEFPDNTVQSTAYPGPYDQDLNTTDSVEFLNITQQQTVGVNNYTTTISQNTTYTKFAKVDIIDDGFGGTNTITRNVLLEGSALRFDNSVNSAAYISNDSTSGHLFVQAGNGEPVDGQRNGGDLYLWAGARASGATAGGNIIMNSNGGDIFIGPLENTDQIRIGGGPGYAGESTTTFYGDVNFASGKSVTFTGATVDFNGATIDWTPIVSGAIQNNGLPVGTRFTQPVPATSKGTSGNVQGAVTFDSDYIYYCTATYSEVAWANTATVDILGGNGTETGIAVTLDVVPSVGWFISDGTTTSTINQVTPQGSWYVIFWDDTITFEVGDTVYYGATAAVQPDIWKRVAWSGDTW